MAKTIAAWFALSFVLWLVIAAPTNAEHLVLGLGAFLSTAASGLSHLFTSI